MQLRRVIITAVLAMLAVAAVAPRSRAEGYAGFRGGVNLASFSGDGTFSPYGPLLPGEMFPKNAFLLLEYSDTRKGFTGAAFVGWDKGKMGFRSEIGYTMKGGKSGDASIKLDYVEFAPLFTFRLPVSSGIAVSKNGALTASPPRHCGMALSQSMSKRGKGISKRRCVG